MAAPGPWTQPRSFKPSSPEPCSGEARCTSGGEGRRGGALAASSAEGVEERAEGGTHAGLRRLDKARWVQRRGSRWGREEPLGSRAVVVSGVSLNRQ